MRDFLAQMALASGARAAAARAREPEGVMRRRALEAPPAPPLRLSPGGFDCFAEWKARSPSAGWLVPAEDVTPDRVAAQATAYARGGAVALSVLTEPDAFAGHLDHLTAAATAVEIPAMRKDFLVDPYQVLETRAAGGGGILLIARILTDGRLQEMLDAAGEMGCFVLLEAFGVNDLDRVAPFVGRATPPRVLLGLNARDLATLEVDDRRLERLAPFFPPGALRVAESGFAAPADAARAARVGYRAALVGTTLMRHPDPASAIAALIAAGRAALAGDGP